MLFLFIFASASYCHYFAFWIAAPLLCPEIKDYLVRDDDHSVDGLTAVHTTSIGRGPALKTRFIVPESARATALLESYIEARHWAQYGGAGLVLAAIVFLFMMASVRG